MKVFNGGRYSSEVNIDIPAKQSITILSEDEWAVVERLLLERGFSARDLEFLAGHDPATVLNGGRR